MLAKVGRDAYPEKSRLCRTAAYESVPSFMLTKSFLTLLFWGSARSIGPSSAKICQKVSTARIPFLSTDESPEK